MKSKKIKLKIGIIGCGAIGSRMAQNIVKDLKDDCKLTPIFDIDASKSAKLKKSLSSKVIIAPTLKDLIKSSDLVVEAVNAINTKDIIKTYYLQFMEPAHGNLNLFSQVLNAWFIAYY